MQNLKDMVEKYTLQNAIKFDGKANAGAIIGKLISEEPSLKKDIKNLTSLVNQTIKEISKLSVDEMIEKLRKIAPELLEKKEKKERGDNLKELDNVDKEKGVVMRFAPSPSGPFHIGHVFTGGLTSLYVKKYGGKFILRIEDTNPENIDPDAYEQLPKDADWVFGNVSEVWIQSDRMEIYYDYAERFLKKGAVYICTCSQEDFKKYVENMEECPCRRLSIDENMSRWRKMFDKNYFKEGDAVMRFKADMKDKNPAMRDFPLIRINDTEHPRQGRKYRVWPLMNFCVTVDDIEAGMTHIIRAKDHADNAKRQEKMYKALDPNLKVPYTYFLGRYNFEGLEISKTKVKAKIKAGEYTGWDDIRLPFIVALKRRGYQPEAFMKYTALVGLSPVDKTIPADELFKTLNAFNKEIIDPIAKRFFFVHNYEIIKIKNAPKQILNLRMHPTNDLGERTIEVNDEFMVQKDDLEHIKEGEICRLMDCLNFIKEGDQYIFHSKEYEIFRENKGKKIMHFLPKEGNLKAEVLMPDEKATLIKGFAERNISKLKVGDIIQFERFGFCRLDAIEEGVYKFWYTHK